MSCFDKEKNPYNIDKNAHYFMIMYPYDNFGFVNGNQFDWVECIIDETEYTVDEGYKITVVPLDCRYAIRSFYQSDFVDIAIKKTSENMKVRTKTQYIPLTNNVYLVWSGNYVE